jgi:hypothetical protein
LLNSYATTALLLIVIIMMAVSGGPSDNQIAHSNGHASAIELMNEVKAGWTWGQAESQAPVSLSTVDGGAAAIAFATQDQLVTGQFQYLPLDLSDALVICNAAVDKVDPGGQVPQAAAFNWMSGCVAGLTGK